MTPPLHFMPSLVIPNIIIEQFYKRIGLHFLIKCGNLLTHKIMILSNDNHTECKQSRFQGSLTLV